MGGGDVGRLDDVDDGKGVGAIKYERRIFPLSHTTGAEAYESGRFENLHHHVLKVRVGPRIKWKYIWWDRR